MTIFLSPNIKIHEYVGKSCKFAYKMQHSPRTNKKELKIWSLKDCKWKLKLDEIVEGSVLIQMQGSHTF